VKTKRALFIFVMAIAAFSCVKDKAEADYYNINLCDVPQLYPAKNNVLGSWIVYSYKNLSNNSIIKKEDVDSWNGMDVKVKFIPGSFCGFNTSNEIAGHYLISDSTLTIDVYGGTKVGQPEWGNMFSAIVYSIETFERTENQLILYYNKRNNCVILNQMKSPIECKWTYSPPGY
jgi:hypothetical protein